MLKIIKYQLIVFCCSIMFILSLHQAYAASITLEWNASVKPALSDIAGYKIYYGTESGNYTYPPIDVGKATNYTINDLDKDKIYYLAVIAYASSGEESDFSAELSTFNEFAGTAQTFFRKRQWNSCETEEDLSDTFAVYLSFNYLPDQGNFIFEPDDDTRISCNAGTFIQREDNMIEAECVKRGPLGIVIFNTFIFEGIGNASLKDPLEISAKVFNVLNPACPVYVIKMENLLPVQK
jgi:hypothetical protein